MELRNLSSIGPAFILVGFLLVFVFAVLYASCVGNTSGCGFSTGLGIITWLFSLGTTMILSGAVLASAGHIAKYLGPGSAETKRGVGLRVCQKCGGEVESDAAFCSHCGSPLSKP